MMKEKIQHKIDMKTKPVGALGKLEEIAKQICMIQNTLTPELINPTHIVFAGDHGLADAGVSPYPKEVTAQMVLNFLNGGAAINVFCRQHKIDLKVVDAGVDYDFDPEADLIHEKIAKGTKNMLQESAMTEVECNDAMLKGASIVQEVSESGCNTISFGEMGIGNTSAAALLLHKFSGASVENCTGRGTGHTDEGLQRKIAILESVSSKYDTPDPIAILATYGGFEIAMMVGAMLEAKNKGMLILIDGFITTSAVLVASEMYSTILENCIFCHCSDEQGHQLMLEYLDVEALVDLGMRLGEGTGAVVCYPLIESAVLFMNEMASFESAGVSTKE